MQTKEIIKALEGMADPRYLDSMKRFSITTDFSLGVNINDLRKFSKQLPRDQVLAQKLWKSGLYEARIIAGIIHPVEKVTSEQMESWVRDFNSWSICDHICGTLFDKTPFAFAKAKEWTLREEEYVKRAGFVLMATLAIHDKQAKDSEFLKFFPMIKREAIDDRNFVKKAVNWALRQIGKRNPSLNKQAIKVALDVQRIGTSPAKWIASNALRELRSTAVQKRLAGANKNKPKKPEIKNRLEKSCDY